MTKRCEMSIDFHVAVYTFMTEGDTSVDENLMVSDTIKIISQ